MTNRSHRPEPLCPAFNHLPPRRAGDVRAVHEIRFQRRAGRHAGAGLALDPGGNGGRSRGANAPTRMAGCRGTASTSVRRSWSRRSATIPRRMELLVDPLDGASSRAGPRTSSRPASRSTRGRRRCGPRACSRTALRAADASCRWMPITNGRGRRCPSSPGRLAGDGHEFLVGAIWTAGRRRMARSFGRWR